MSLLGALDQSPLRKGGTAAQAVQETIALAKHCETLGYQRYWVAEHHNARVFASPSPEIILARLGAETNHIRIGTGGVMLPHYSPFKVAENFRLLETLYPGRIDLGLGRAPGTDPRTAAALQSGPQAYPIEVFPSQVKLLRDILEDASDVRRWPDEHPYKGIHATPLGPTMPQMWMLGSGGDGALVAAELGLPYCYAYFINPQGGERVMEIYRERFKPSDDLEHPKGALAVGAIVAETEEEAAYLAATRNHWAVKLLGGQPSEFLSPEEALAMASTYDAGEEARLELIRERNIRGTPAQVRDKLLNLGKAFRVDEFIVLTITYDFEARKNSYELLAKAFDVKAPAQALP